MRPTKRAERISINVNPFIFFISFISSKPEWLLADYGAGFRDTVGVPRPGNPHANRPISYVIPNGRLHSKGQIPRLGCALTAGVNIPCGDERVGRKAGVWVIGVHEQHLIGLQLLMQHPPCPAQTIGSPGQIPGRWLQREKGQNPHRSKE
jgi:hypothetical protein